MKKIYFGIAILILFALSTVILIQQNKPEKVTFEECEELGGVAWQVDLYHPDICPSCAEYRECENEYNDYSDVCPDCYDACPACQSSFSLYESCPECYGPCQTCQNSYLNDFENEAQRYTLCPECLKCDECREELNLAVMNCPACISCNECKQENKEYEDIEDVCPQINPCTECMGINSPYPDNCPDGREKIGEISDAATWFQCCK
ncbi:MAG: hypothetical protein MUO76_07025 [Anaerolineaceae bacterium]|nr:hypothetical protein [Anaerolineaceae bacterium]